MSSDVQSLSAATACDTLRELWSGGSPGYLSEEPLLRGAQFDLLRVLKDVTASIGDPADLEMSLDQITRGAREVIPGVDHASVSVMSSDGAIVTLAPTDPRSVQGDLLQYECGEGPCVEAVRTRADVATDDIAQDARWPRYGPQAAALGIKAQLALTLSKGDLTLGALNLYSDTSGPLRESHDLAELFAAQAALALDFSRTVTTLGEAVATRREIGMAMGLVMERYGLDAERAFAFLVRVSQTTNTKLRIVAAEFVKTSAVGARSSRSDSPVAHGLGS